MKEDSIKQIVKEIVKEILESTEPSIGGSYSDQQTCSYSSNVRMERDPLNDPMLKEDIDDKKEKISNLLSTPNITNLRNSLKLIYEWIKTNQITFNEFIILYNEIQKHNKTDIRI